MEDKQTLVAELEALLKEDITAIKEQVEEKKTAFYRIYRQEQEAARKKAEELGQNMEEYKPVIDEIEQNFRQLLNIYKTQRAEAAAKHEAELKDNQARKEVIIEKMKALAETEMEDVSGNLQTFRDLQAEWKTIGQVPAPVAADIWKQYNHYQEQFYDMVKLNSEMRDYDFKKNLEQKTALCVQAEALQDFSDIVEANRVLQKLHDDWAAIGPVAREIREELWTRFKTASTVINKRHQAHFDAIHQKEEENLQKKQDIIRRLEEIDVEALTTSKMWEEATERLLAMQAEWRTIGFAPKKQNTQIYEDYRDVCERFFAAKNQFFKAIKDTHAENLQKKRDLLQKALELKDSEDWKAATEALVELQKEWKTIGPVARKYSDEIWKQFSAACDSFFDRKKAAFKADREAYQQRRNQQREAEAAGKGRRSLTHQYEALQAEIKTFENNIGFFSGKAGALIDSMQKQIDKKKAELKALEAKIAQLDAEEAAE